MRLQIFVEAFDFQNRRCKQKVHRLLFFLLLFSGSFLLLLMQEGFRWTPRASRLPPRSGASAHTRGRGIRLLRVDGTSRRPCPLLPSAPRV